MSKVEQGEYWCCKAEFGRHEPTCKFAAASLPESQPAPEMDYEKEALSLQDAIDNIVPCTDQEVAAIADWLRAHDARVQPAVNVLMDALKSIADPPHDACGCEDHESEDCCVNVGYHCPVCIAGNAIAKFNKGRASQPSSVAGTERLREAEQLLQQVMEVKQPYLVFEREFWTKLTDFVAESALKESSRDPR